MMRRTLTLLSGALLLLFLSFLLSVGCILIYFGLLRCMHCSSYLYLALGVGFSRSVLAEHRVRAGLRKPLALRSPAPPRPAGDQCRLASQ